MLNIDNGENESFYFFRLNSKNTSFAIKENHSRTVLDQNELTVVINRCSRFAFTQECSR